MTPSSRQDETNCPSGGPSDFEAYEASILEEYMDMACDIKYQRRSGPVHPSHFNGTAPINISATREDCNHRHPEVMGNVQQRTERITRDSTDVGPCCQIKCDRDVLPGIKSFYGPSVLPACGPSPAKYPPNITQSQESQITQANHSSTQLKQNPDPSQNHIPTTHPNWDNCNNFIQVDSDSQSEGGFCLSNSWTNGQELHKSMSLVQCISSDDSILEELVIDWPTKRPSVIVGNTVWDYGMALGKNSGRMWSKSGTNIENPDSRDVQLSSNRVNDNLPMNQSCQTQQLNQWSLGELPLSSEPNVKTNILPHNSHNWPGDLRGVSSASQERTIQNSERIWSHTDGHYNWSVRESKPFIKQAPIENAPFSCQSRQDNSNSSPQSLVSQGVPDTHALSESIRNTPGSWKSWSSDPTGSGPNVSSQYFFPEGNVGFPQPVSHLGTSDMTCSTCFQPRSQEIKGQGVPTIDPLLEALASIGVFPTPCSVPDCPGDLSRTFQEFPLPRRKSAYRVASCPSNSDQTSQQFTAGLESFEGLIQDVFEMEPNQDEQRVLLRRMRNREAAKRCRKKKKEEFISLLLKRAMLLIEYHRYYHVRYPLAAMIRSNNS